tara:strand:- start:50 stop:664 length:615 start_codon:yes stop_codon:yes gene_type:complete
MKNKIFKINDVTIVKKKYYYQVDNFYKYPKEVENFFNRFPPFIHKWNTPKSLNTIDFLDCSHKIAGAEDFIEVEKELYKILNRDYSKADQLVLSNYTKFYNLKNKYKKNYWWPHTDEDCFYNCLIYLNKPTCDGTNLYKKINDNEGYNEHTHPWQSKNKYKLLCNIKSAYNRLVIFKSDIYHGMAHNTDKFINRFRKNQVVFIK